MERSYIITDKGGKLLKKSTLTEPEARMVAKAGFRVFDAAVDGLGDEITPQLTGLFGRTKE